MTTEFIQIKRQRLVDSREKGKSRNSQTYDDIKSKLLQTGWEQTQLRYGDYFMHTFDMKKLGVTRKSVEDMLQSLGENFAKQLEEMLNYYDICVLLIEGSFNVEPDTDRVVGAYNLANVTMQQIRNWRHRWQAKGFILEPTLNENQTVKRLNELYALYMKPYSVSAKSRGYTDDRVLSFPSGCRGKTASKILESYSLRDVANMSTEQLLKCEGVGKKRAEGIYNHFNKRNITEVKI